MTSVVVVGSVVGSIAVMGSVAFVIFIDIDSAATSLGCVVVSFIGEFFLLLQVTWVHLSSLLGWSPVSGFLLSFVDVVSSAAATLFVIVVFLLVF